MTKKSNDLPGTPLPDDDDLITRLEFCKENRCSIAKAERMAMDGSGPPYIVLGGKKRGRALYRRGDVRAWLLSCRRTSTSDRGQS